MSIDPFDSEGLKANLRHRTVRGGAITLVTQGALFAIQFVNGVLMARLLNPADFGLVSMVMAVVGFLEIFKDLGLSAATVQQPNITRGQVNVLFWVNTSAGAAMSVLTVLLAPVLAWFYGRPELLQITVAVAAGFLISGLGSQQKALLRRTMQFKKLAQNDMSCALAMVTVGLSTAWLGWGYWSIVAQQLTKSVVSTVGFWLASDWRPGRYRWDPTAKPMLHFGGFLAGNSVMNYLARNIDNVAIGWMWGAGPLGLYSRAYNLLLLPLSGVISPLTNNVALPAISRLRDDPKRYRDVYLSLVRSTGFFMIPPIAVTLACSDSLITLLFGPKWIEVSDIYRWLGIAALTEPITVTCGILFVSQGRSRQLVVTTIINSIISLVSILAALRWGPAAVAGSYAIVGLLVRTPILFRSASLNSPIRLGDLYRVLISQLAIGGVVFVLAYVLGQRLEDQADWLKIASATTVGAVVMGVTLLFSASQRQSVHRIITVFRSPNREAK